MTAFRHPPGRFAAVLVLLTAVLVASCAPRVQPAGPEPRAPDFAAEEFVTRDGLTLPVRIWAPEGAPRAAIIGVHGFNDYSHAFEMPASALSRRGVITYAYDQRGFGRTVYRGQWPGAARLARDLADFAALVKDRHPGVPVYVLGVSMGGAVTLLAEGEDMIDVDGLILVAPAVWGFSTMPFYYDAALWIGAHLAPWATVTARGLDITPSDNLQMLRELAADPLVIKETRIDALYGLVGLMDRALAEASDVETPTLVLYGQHDEIVPKEPTRRLIEELPRARTRVAVYEDGYHMLLRDLQAEVVYRDVASWLADRTAAMPSGAERAADAWLAADAEP